MKFKKENISNNIKPWFYIKSIWSLLPSLKKAQAVKLWLMMVLGMLLEMLSVGLIIPLIALVTKKNSALSVPYFGDVIHRLQIESPNTLIVVILLILVIAYLIKNLYLLYLTWKQGNFVFGLQAELSKKLFSTYLRQPYSFHLQNNSANLIQNVYGEMFLFINSAVNPCIYLLAESLVVMGLLGLLLYVEPLGTLMVFSVTLIVAYIYRSFTKAHVLEWGEKRLFHEGLRLKHLHQGLGGVKDIKLLGREGVFLNEYAINTYKSMRMYRLQNMIQSMPRLWLELLAVLGVSIITGGMILRGASMLDVLPTVALFAAVSFRLMPSLNRMLNAIQQLQFGLPTVGLLQKELSLEVEGPKTSSLNRSALTQSIELQNITFKYSAERKIALRSASIRIQKGSFVGFIGESGSGKSTLIDLILGLLKPNEGKILVDGVDIHEDLRSWQDQVGYVPQSIYLTDDTLRKNIAFGISEEMIDDSAVDQAIKTAKLDTFVDGLESGVETHVGERGVRLSGGQRQRIGIARALYHNPEVLVLDEATSALDTKTEKEVMAAVTKLKGSKTIIVVAHRLSTLRECQYLYSLKNGYIQKERNPRGVLENARQVRIGDQ